MEAMKLRLPCEVHCAAWVGLRVLTFEFESGPGRQNRLPSAFAIAAGSGRLKLLSMFAWCNRALRPNTAALQGWNPRTRRSAPTSGQTVECRALHDALSAISAHASLIRKLSAEETQRQ